MSRITKWKIEKTKVKVVFRLQFHATHIPQSGWDKLFISFIPADSGKATSKTTKANLRNGTCRWADPIYETTRLLQDIKTREYDEKLYKLVVGMGTSRSSILGEANINLADFADALKPKTVALSLDGCEAGTTLHVTVQLLTSKTGYREFEQQRELREGSLQTTGEQGTPDGSAEGTESYPDQNLKCHMEKVNSRVKFKRQSKGVPRVSSVEGEEGVNEDYADAAVGFDGSSTTSESMYTEKHDVSTTHEVDNHKSAVSSESGGLPLSQTPQPEKKDASDNQFPPEGSDSVQGWSMDYSAANNFTAACEDHSKLKGSLEAAESSFLDLKLEVSSLQNHADEIGIDTQKIIQQLAAEISSGQELAKDVAVLKSECSKFRDDFKQFKISNKLSFAYTIREPIETDWIKSFQNLRSKWLEGLLLMEDRLRDVQNKVSMRYQESDFTFLSLQLEALAKVLQDLRQETGQAISERSVAHGGQTEEMSLHKGKQLLAGTGSDVDMFHPEGIVHYLSVLGLVSHDSDSVDSTLASNGKILELLKELDESKTERESLARKMDQMECYYEALVQELEQNQRQMMGELQNLRNDHSACLYTISSSKTEIDRMHQDMNEKLMKFAEDKGILESLKNELERRAVSAEAALKRARLNYSIAVGQLQKDLELLSSQVLSMYETNENLIKEAFSDSSLLSDGCPDLVYYQKNSEETHTSNQLLCQNRIPASNKQHLGEDILLMDLKRSLHVQEGLYKQVEEEVFQMQSVNIYLDVFSKSLQETLVEASIDLQLMKEEIDELSQQLRLSTESKELLMMRLQNAMNDIHSLNESKEVCIAKSNDISQQNQMLEANLKNLLQENNLLTQKISNLEALLTEYRGYESKYLATSEENAELKNFLKKESTENTRLCNDISTLQEELKSIRTNFDELVSMKDNLQNVVHFVSAALQKLLISYDNECSDLSLCSRSVWQDSESNDLEGFLLQLENIQQSACNKIHQLLEEKRVLMDEKHMAQVSIKTKESDILMMKQKFEHDLQDMILNIGTSSALLQKLQSEFELIVSRLKSGFNAEEIYSQNHKELWSGLNHLEVELEQLNTRNQDLAQQIFGLDTLSGDLETCKLTIAAITEEKEALKMFLQEKMEESVKISSEIKLLKESLHSLDSELHAERTFRAKLEKTVMDLTSQLNEKQCQLQDFDENEKELVDLKQVVKDLESENSRVHHLLQQSEEHLKDVLRELSSISYLEAQFSELHEFSIASDIIVIFTRAQFGGHIEELVRKFHSTCQQLDVLQKKNLDMESTLNGFLSRESAYIEENARLLRNLDSLKSKLEASTFESKTLIDQNNAIIAEFKEYRNRTENVNNTSTDESQHTLEVARLEYLLASCSKEVEDLFFSKEEVEVRSMVLQDKLDELKTSMMLLKQSDDELVMLQNQCSKLTKRLSEQVSKVEEFKELKSKADSECHNACGRRGPDGPPVAMQESLRITVIKEQYETKLQELKQQLSLSKKYNEEMMWKLQDAISELENRKKSEASQRKRNEDLGMKIMDLEAELLAMLSEKRNLSNAYDLMKAEKECSVISLECCKQEKQELEAFLQKCNEEKSQIAVELTFTKELIENSKSCLNVQSEDNYVFHKMTCTSDGPVEVEVQARNSVSEVPTLGIDVVDMVPGDHSSADAFSTSLNHKDAKSTCVSSKEDPQTTHLQPKDALSFRGTNEYQTARNFTEEDIQQREQNYVALTRSLKSTMEHLDKELERMKNDNLHPPVDDHVYEPSFPGLQRELAQLHEANQELQNMFPLFNEFSISGNALERVLALEMELAEALQAKKKLSFQFQSSFLKQHNDEEAIFRSFRDINELIKNMLELKERHASMETELKEMHDRYSQLSLKFAEVEGERQKLRLTLKNNRASKKGLLQSPTSFAQDSS